MSPLLLVFSICPKCLPSIQDCRTSGTSPSFPTMIMTKLQLDWLVWKLKMFCLWASFSMAPAGWLFNPVWSTCLVSMHQASQWRGKLVVFIEGKEGHVPIWLQYWPPVNDRGMIVTPEPPVPPEHYPRQSVQHRNTKLFTLNKIMYLNSLYDVGRSLAQKTAFHLTPILFAHWYRQVQPPCPRWSAPSYCSWWAQPLSYVS